MLPSLWEGLPRGAIEAVVFGKPVIATDIAGTREAVVHGQNGLLVPPRNPRKLAEAIQDLMDHPEKIRCMSKEAVRFSHKFSFPTMVQTYHDLYKELIALLKK